MGQLHPYYTFDEVLLRSLLIASVALSIICLLKAVSKFRETQTLQEHAKSMTTNKGLTHPTPVLMPVVPASLSIGTSLTATIREVEDSPNTTTTIVEPNELHHQLDALPQRITASAPPPPPPSYYTPSAQDGEEEEEGEEPGRNCEGVATDLRSAATAAEFEASILTDGPISHLPQTAIRSRTRVPLTMNCS